MSPISVALEYLVTETSALTGRIGRYIDASTMGVLDRSGVLSLNRPGLASPNGSCRLFRAADGWMAANFARDEDRDLAPAWLSCDSGPDLWGDIAVHAAFHTRATLIERASLLGLPVASVGEITSSSFEPALLNYGMGTSRRGPLSVVDLSALWAGPLCAAVLAAAGAAVTRIESSRRPDPTRLSSPDFFHRLNGLKQCVSLDLGDFEGQERLRETISVADVLVTSARPRAFVGLGLDPEWVFATNPGLVWVAITGYGWTGDGAARVAFGDDAAAAGGLVRWTKRGAPRFLGDALADPITGLVAAAGAIRGLIDGGGVIVDVSLARSAAAAASLCRIPPAP